jgi:hypothetical protein
MANVQQVRRDGNGRDHGVPPPISEGWNRPPEQTPEKRIARPVRSDDNMRRSLKRNQSRDKLFPNNEYGKLWSQYYKALRVLRNAFGKRTLGSDQRLANRAMRVAEALDELKHVCGQLDTLERARG